MSCVDADEHFFTLRFNHYDYPQTHEHKYWEFMLVTSGSYVHNINGATDIIGKNTLCLIRPTDVHSIITNEPRSTHINFAVSDDQMRLMLNSLYVPLYNKLLYGQLPVVKISDRQTDLYIQFALEDQTLGLDQLLPKIFLHFMTDIYTLFVLTEKEKMQRDIPIVILKVISLLKDKNNFSRNLQDILKEENYSYPHISRLFKRHMKTSLLDYFTEAKLDYARIRLEQSQLKIIDIAEEIGYKSLSQFNQSFHKRFSVSPSVYRKAYIMTYVQFGGEQPPRYSMPTPPTKPNKAKNPK